MMSFRVVPPTEKDRETCLCKFHESSELIQLKLLSADCSGWEPVYKEWSAKMPH